MKIAFTILLVILTALAIASGATKIALMQQEVEFFGRHGFSNPMILALGVAQVIGGIAMAFAKTRFYGAAIVAVTFLISLVALLMDGNVSVSIVTFVAMLLLGVVMRQSWRARDDRQLPIDS